MVLKNEPAHCKLAIRRAAYFDSLRKGCASVWREMHCNHHNCWVSEITVVGRTDHLVTGPVDVLCLE